MKSWTNTFRKEEIQRIWLNLLMVSIQDRNSTQCWLIGFGMLYKKIMLNGLDNKIQTMMRLQSYSEIKEVIERKIWAIFNIVFYMFYFLEVYNI